MYLIYKEDNAVGQQREFINQNDRMPLFFYYDKIVKKFYG